MTPQTGAANPAAGNSVHVRSAKSIGKRVWLMVVLFLKRWKQGRSGAVLPETDRRIMARLACGVKAALALVVSRCQRDKFSGLLHAHPPPAD
jgi:hypothetical protein